MCWYVHSIYNLNTHKYMLKYGAFYQSVIAILQHDSVMFKMFSNKNKFKLKSLKTIVLYIDMCIDI